MVFEARPAKGCLVPLIAVSLAFAAFGIWVSGTILPFYDPHPEVGWPLAAFWLAAAFIFYRRMQNDEPVVRIDEFGIQARQIDRLVPWKEILSIGAMPMRNGDFTLNVYLKEPAAPVYASGMRRFIAGIDQGLGFGSFGVNLAASDKTFPQMLAAIRRFHPELLDASIPAHL